jgi:hypothetical protein
VKARARRGCGGRERGWMWAWAWAKKAPSPVPGPWQALAAKAAVRGMTLYLEVKLEGLPMRAFDMAVDKGLDDGEMRDARGEMQR